MAGLIVAAVDGSRPALAAVDWAADDAHRRGARLRIVHVREPWANEHPFHGVEGFGESLTEHCEGVLALAADRARQRAPGLDVTTGLVTGAVIERLMTESARAGVTVLGSRGMGGFAGLVLGSVGLGLATHAVAPLVVVRRTQQTVYGEVVVGFDGSPHSEAAVDFAFEEARLRQARVRAVYAWDIPMFSPFAVGYTREMGEIFDRESSAAGQRLAPWRDKHPDVPLVESAVCGHPIPALADASRTADLVVVGSRGRGGFGGALLGSVSHGVLYRAHCPVAIVRPGETGR
ncbi:universal stress protein [Planotetraspora sp. A-T 1434]|uniref:universal stress protein n=1 Tax=Planotetraspora sp. A-T 1434 TaxID=2979219 RepID=UPI0021C20129|nr:universal stress protein [Planotetraspora sp. A-T 1434]MCT9931200.1 universal stress protein [Planotetraspora sp. A-T 1434]